MNCFTCNRETDNPCDSRGVARLRKCPSSKHGEQRDTFVIPEGHAAVLDAEGRATGETVPVKSDGGSSSYYQLPEGAKELGDLIEYKGMDFNTGNVFKACYRLGEKDGNDRLYDIRKMKWFVARMEAQELRRQGHE